MTPRAPTVATAHLPGMIRAGPHVAAFLPGRNRQSPPDRLSPRNLVRSPRGWTGNTNFPGATMWGGRGLPEGLGKSCSTKGQFDWESAGDRARLLPQLRALGPAQPAAHRGARRALLPGQECAARRAHTHPGARRSAPAGEGAGDRAAPECPADLFQEFLSHNNLLLLGVLFPPRFPLCVAT